jgi:hypothetical protein
MDLFSSSIYTNYKRKRQRKKRKGHPGGPAGCAAPRPVRRLLCVMPGPAGSGQTRPLAGRLGRPSQPGWPPPRQGSRSGGAHRALAPVPINEIDPGWGRDPRDRCQPADGPMATLTCWRPPALKSLAQMESRRVSSRSSMRLGSHARRPPIKGPCGWRGQG